MHIQRALYLDCKMVGKITFGRLFPEMEENWQKVTRTKDGCICTGEGIREGQASLTALIVSTQLRCLPLQNTVIFPAPHTGNNPGPVFSSQLCPLLPGHGRGERLLSVKHSTLILPWWGSQPRWHFCSGGEWGDKCWILRPCDYWRKICQQ